ncbi:MAG: carboxypeptidase regulatory-like domain-containing protein [Bryobacterales bacterium]|nr:carboxypeptidase regulatory-like domain-containing protein [Bryobacterales bacterium]
MKRNVLAAAAAFTFCSAIAPGQNLTSISGTVSDITGAAIPGATVRIENLGTQASRTVVSDSQGTYTIAQVAPGDYRLLGKASGFDDVVVNGIRLMVSSPATINVRFEKIGSVSAVVEVTAETMQINTADASIGNAFGTKSIIQLPFEGRNVVGLLSLQPGVSFLPPEQQGTLTVADRSGSVNGGRSDQANVTLDGVDVNEQQTREAFKSVLRVTLDSV